VNVLEIWRYPVKTLAGEMLERAAIGPLGIEGDRIVHVENVFGETITSRTHPRFLGLRGALGLDGEPTVEGRPWKDRDVAAEVVKIAGRGA